MTKEEKVLEILKRLKKQYPNPTTALKHSNALELLVATMLSAQTTDKLVNSLTPELFKHFKNVDDFANAQPEDLFPYISKVNFYGNKAKNIIAAAKMIKEKHAGKVPDTMEELDALPGVARKTANVVLWNAYGKNEGVCVDTHVMRLSQRLGLTDKKDPVKIEEDLMKIVPQKEWGDFSHLLILYGREFCPARPHVCSDCPLKELCPDLK